jgi:hypothetical protein
LSAGKPRILSIATTLRRSLMANRFRRLLIVGILLFVIAPALVWLLIYSLRGFDYPQQEAAGNESPSDIQQPQGEDANGQHQAECPANRSSQRPFVVSLKDDLWTMSLNGSDLTSVTSTESLNGSAVSEYDPAWSPDRKRMAFTRSHFGAASGSATPEAQYYIYVMNADGSRKTRLRHTNSSKYPEHDADW